MASRLPGTMLVVAGIGLFAWVVASTMRVAAAPRARPRPCAAIRGGVRRRGHGTMRERSRTRSATGTPSGLISVAGRLDPRAHRRQVAQSGVCLTHVWSALGGI